MRPACNPTYQERREITNAQFYGLSLAAALTLACAALLLLRSCLTLLGRQHQHHLVYQLAAWLPTQSLHTGITASMHMHTCTCTHAHVRVRVPRSVQLVWWLTHTARYDEFRMWTLEVCADPWQQETVSTTQPLIAPWPTLRPCCPSA